MISEATLSGYVLEEVLARLLRENGYTRVHLLDRYEYLLISG